jgi:restriction system protein
MAIPRWDEITLPLLRYAERGPFRNSDAVGPLAAEFKLTPEEIAELHPNSGQGKFANKIYWAAGQLGMAKLLNKHDDVYQITESSGRIKPQVSDEFS